MSEVKRLSLLARETVKGVRILAKPPYPHKLRPGPGWGC
jgi:hypothetical protein